MHFFHIYEFLSNFLDIKTIFLVFDLKKDKVELSLLYFGWSDIEKGQSISQKDAQ
jgi:hypothetical protein